jgi:hypothetical protein
MTLNPLAFTEDVVADFLRYQVTAYPFSDPDLHAQMRQLLRLDEGRRTPLLRGPYVTLSRAFESGATLASLVEDGVLHPAMAARAAFPTMYGHQEKAIRSIVAGKTTLVSTGTGSGKTEAFLYPVISRCFELRDAGAPPGIVAVLVYPMNALAEDQLGRLRALLAGSGITFGMYVGPTPENEAGVAGVRLAAGSSREDYFRALADGQKSGRGAAVHPPEERVSRETMRKAGEQPRILLTNVRQLELQLTRQKDVELFAGARLDYLVFDEAHTYRGAVGAETAVLVRRLRSYCRRDDVRTACVATSATLADPERGDAAARAFASRFFGVPGEGVTVIGEKFADEDRPAGSRRTPPPADPATTLRRTLDALSSDEDAGPRVAAVLAGLTRDSIAPDTWEDALFGRLGSYEVVARLAGALTHPRPLADLATDLEGPMGRAVSEEEVVTWLLLGAAARREDRPLLRPVAHVFLRGVGGAVVTFPAGSARAQLFLSSEDAAGGSEGGLYHLPVLTCRTCGQHYFETHLADWRYTGAAPEGGRAAGDGVVWEPLSTERGGGRAILLDRLVGEVEDDDDDDGAPLPHTTMLAMCRCCGAVHDTARAACDGCGSAGPLVPVRAVRSPEREPGSLGRCVACGTGGRRSGGRYWEPARAVRAVHVADVHVLAQSMLQHAERRRLLVFTDNRQDAAFQAGWMQDHARRFRLRALMHDEVRGTRLSVGDIVQRLDRRLDDDDDLSRALIPEVWAVQRKEPTGQVHQEERRRFLRIQVLRELTTSPKQRLGLEPWGRIRVDYHDLEPTLPFVATWAARLGIPAERLADGVGAILDDLRRRMLVLDRELELFGRRWDDVDREVQRGYLPVLRGVPKGLVLARSGGADRSRLVDWSSSRGGLQQMFRGFGLEEHDARHFGDELWVLLTTHLALLVPVTLRWAPNRPIAGTSGSHQLDADRFSVVSWRGWYECARCRRRQPRPTPLGVCLAWRCGGTLSWREEDPDDFDLAALDRRFVMVRPREHSAQVPHDDRDRIERLFKDETSEAVNTLVATPTLELGVDIGGLDTVLMRNVPPLPSNYWQRAGRAGRRHRMAVNVTHVRAVSHDRAYFAEPLKLLQGRVDPPRFNLSNGVMVDKHVHAVVLTRLHQLTASSWLPPEEREDIRDTLDLMFPRLVRDYLWNTNRTVRSSLFDTAPLGRLIAQHRQDLVEAVTRVFEDGWPAEDAAVTVRERLALVVDGMASALRETIQVLARRLAWATSQRDRLDAERRRKGTLDPDEDAFYRRCDQLVKRLRGDLQRRRSEGEGYDDAVTFGVLAAEGFLPGYGLDTGAIIGTAEFPVHAPGMRSVELRRPVAIALREYVPGVLVYANGYRFTPRLYRLDPEQERLTLSVDVGRQAMRDASPAAGSLGAGRIEAVPMSDVVMPHRSNISDDEDFRSQLSLVVLGQELERDDGGLNHAWGEGELVLRRGLDLRLANVGPAALAAEGTLGFPMCTVCGQTRSPFSSPAELVSFTRDHEARCHRTPGNVAIYARITADSLLLPGLADRTDAYSLTETLRMAMSRVLEMEMDDLHILVMGRSGSDEVDAYLYDPMPGGSGLLQMALTSWPDVVAAAREVLDCPSACAASCIDCLQTYRNAFYHAFLDRHRALELLGTRGDQLDEGVPLPARQGTRPDDGRRTHAPSEDRYFTLVTAARLPTPERQHRVDLGAWGSTTPDFYWELADEDEPGLCVFVDGLSRGIHGGPDQQAEDRRLRDALEEKGYRVLAIAATQLEDRDAIRGHLRRVARALGEAEAAARLNVDTSWWPDASPGPATSPEAPAPSPVHELQSIREPARQLVEHVCADNVPIPVVGYEIYDDGAPGWPLEAAWPAHRVAVLVDALDERDAWLAAHGWSARHADAWTPEQLKDAINGSAG